MNTLGIIVPVQKLSEESYALVICYPKPSSAELEKRIKELKELGISAIEFSGSKVVANLPVLGKGCVGVVVKAYRGGEEVALKIRRVDADRSGMHHEAKMLAIANQLGVGPKLLNSSDNFLVMQYIRGKLLPEWLESCTEIRLKLVMKEILEQCWRLDAAGLDHGELSHAPKHIIIDEMDKPFIVDFETASLNRKPSNVTSMVQFLFIRGAVAEKINNMLGSRNENLIVEALRRYKMDRSRSNFEIILETCGVYVTTL